MYHMYRCYILVQAQRIQIAVIHDTSVTIYRCCGTKFFFQYIPILFPSLDYFLFAWIPFHSIWTFAGTDSLVAGIPTWVVLLWFPWISLYAGILKQLLNIIGHKMWPEYFEIILLHVLLIRKIKAHQFQFNVWFDNLLYSASNHTNCLLNFSVTENPANSFIIICKADILFITVYKNGQRTFRKNLRWHGGFVRSRPLSPKYLEWFGIT